MSSCHYCGTPFQRSASTPGDKPQNYCTPRCRKNANNLEATRAKAVYRFLYHWRIKRGKDAAYEFGRMCNILDSYISDDRADGLPPPRLPTPQEDVGRGGNKRLTNREKPLS